MKKGTEKKVMTYRNNNKRVINLAQLGLIEEMRPDAYTVNIHGRKDYKLTEKGLLCLWDHIITHPEDIKDIVEYVKKTKLDDRELTKLLNDRVVSTIYSVNLYRKAKGMNEFELPWNDEGHITKFIDRAPKPKPKRG